MCAVVGCGVWGVGRVREAGRGIFRGHRWWVRAWLWGGCIGVAAALARPTRRLAPEGAAQRASWRGGRRVRTKGWADDDMVYEDGRTYVLHVYNMSALAGTGAEP